MHRAPIEHRILASVIATAALGLMIVAAGLTPQREGVGTHTQLGLPSCGWVMSIGIPCPTCGMTTAFAATPRDPLHAFLAQPFGLILALATPVAFWASLHVAAFGSNLGPWVGRLISSRVLLALGGLWLASWLYKMTAM